MNDYEAARDARSLKRRLEQARNAPVAEGERYAFITAAGDRREYTVEYVESEELGLAGFVTLLNPKTGKKAVVTRKWLHDPPGPSGAHWIRATVEEAAAA